MITIMCGEEHFAALQPRRSNIITPENSPRSSLSSLIVIVQATLVVLTEEGEGEFSGVMILLRRGRSAAKCSSATHYSYHFYPLFF